MDDLGAMRLHADILFRYDARGRMACVNDPEGGPAPRLFLGRTTMGQVARFGRAVPDATARRLAGLVGDGGAPRSRRVPPALATAVRAELERLAPVRRQGGGPVYRFPASIQPPSGVVALTEADRARVRATFPWLEDELTLWRPCFAVVCDGAAVAVCFSSRNGARAAEAGVETLPEFRGRGYAGIAAAAWGAAIRRSGRLPLYSTRWGNRASQAVARHLGLPPVGADATWA